MRPPQAGLPDNLYLFTAITMMLGDNLTFKGRAGIEDNAVYGTKLDWEVGATLTFTPVALTASLVQADGETLSARERTIAAVVSIMVEL